MMLSPVVVPPMLWPGHARPGPKNAVACLLQSGMYASVANRFAHRRASTTSERLQCHRTILTWPTPDRDGVRSVVAEFEGSVAVSGQWRPLQTPCFMGDTMQCGHDKRLFERTDSPPPETRGIRRRDRARGPGGLGHGRPRLAPADPSDEQYSVPSPGGFPCSTPSSMPLAERPSCY